MSLTDLVSSFAFDKRATVPVTACPICGEKRSSVIARRDRYGVAVEVRFCAFCTMMWLSPRMTVPEYEDFYEHWYRRFASAYRQKPMGVEAVLENQVAYGRQVAALVAEFVKNDGHTPRILDIGGSSGFVSYAVKTLVGNAEVTVVDPCEAELARAESMGATTKHSLIEKYDIKERGWDVILLCRTIDHIANPMSLLAKISRGLDDGGVAYIDYVDTWMVMESEGFHNAFHIDHPMAFTRESFIAALHRSAMRPLVYQTPDGSSTVGAIIRLCESSNATDIGYDAFDKVRHYQAIERKQWVTHV